MSLRLEALPLPSGFFTLERYVTYAVRITEINEIKTGSLSLLLKANIPKLKNNTDMATENDMTLLSRRLSMVVSPQQAFEQSYSFRNSCSARFASCFW